MSDPAQDSARDQAQDQAQDQAMRRFFLLQAVRASGAVLVLLGVLVQTGRAPALLEGLPPVAGIVMAAAGLLDFFFLPRALARRWRTPD
ncbi:hypothetical protein Saro_2840 [Novosphingobium aromaticivorans DSM 12444]|uniref:Uncharacterized protein n=1 Tax=Novosphingobium aromaticivorans (strain ATCC 700278 / DSM 12444 / CCUG 56034 / CIP 105152 / NBRC 16084 / F199) TaxID=279238 RepID=Q2G4E7_NOVAD|nr:hypothetical protein [Novosphingobium aromaticivorans]ABD27276.1 hypothetical protein Saro_2840 [Novosphingobium aromaticivorans DSM 12444]SCY66018.1 hypothetical protein SAMN05660666_02339 [Novosphingobium aromaticivorans]